MGDMGVKSVLNWAIAVAALAFVLLLLVIIFGNLSGNTGISDVQNTVTITNESFDGVAQGAWINVTGYTLDGYNTSWSSITITQAWNQSSATIIPDTNYTVSAAGVITNTTTAEPFNSQWFNTTISYTYVNSATAPAATSAENVILNYTESAVNTAEQFPTVGTILGIALLILVLLALLVFVIMKMSGMSMGKESKGSFTKGDFA